MFEERRTTVKKRYRVCFIVSLLPYVFVLVYAIYSAIHGIRHSFMMSSNILYGFDGFIYTFVMTFIWNIMIFPLLPICMAYQIAYMVTRKSENKKLIWIATLTVAVSSCLFVFGWRAYYHGLGF